MESILPTFALVALGLFSLVLMRRESPLHLVVALMGMTIVIGLTFPIGSLFVEPETWRNLAVYTTSMGADIQWDYFAFGLGLLLAYILLVRHISTQAQNLPAQLPTGAFFSRDELFVGVLTFLGMGLYLSFIGIIELSTLLYTENLAKKYLIAKGLGPFKLGLHLIILACLWAEAGRVRRSLLMLMRVVAVGIMVWGLLFIHVRTYPAFLLIGYLAIYLRRTQITIASTRFRIVLLFTFLLAFFVVAPLYRTSLAIRLNPAEILTREILDKPSERILRMWIVSEFAHPFMTAFELRRDEEGASQLGRSYLNAPLITIPRFIYPTRPESLAERFVRTNYPDLAARGGGSSFSLVGEAWLNFGALLGPFVIGTLMGILLTLVENSAKRNRNSIIAMVVPYFVVSFAILAHRAEFTVLFKQTVTIILAVGGCMFIYTLGKTPRSHFDK